MKKALKSYILGFILSIILTVLAFGLVEFKIGFSNEVVIILILILAVVQLLSQMIFFLHLGSEKSPRWNLIFFISTLITVLVVIIGSIWIMTHLNYNMTPPEMMKYIDNESGF